MRKTKRSVRVEWHIHVYVVVTERKTLLCGKSRRAQVPSRAGVGNDREDGERSDAD